MRASPAAICCVTKTQSSRWQKLAGLGDEAFERRVAAAKRERRDARETELMRSPNNQFTRRSTVDG